ncbi:MAG: PF20097 family protein [Patescibacteria group bacterium]
MEETKKCPSCGIELEEGFVGNLGQNWKKGKPSGMKISETLGGSKYLLAMRCPKCGLVQFYTRENIEG